MNDFVKMLKASEPNVSDEDARDKFHAFFDEPMNQDMYVTFYSALHGYTRVLELVELFVRSFSKIEKNENEFIYSYQPFMIGKFTEDDIRVMFSYYTNGFICYMETNAGLSELSISIRKRELENIVGLNYGSQKSSH